MSEYLQNLNQEQNQAVLHTEGPVLVLAGAGTGKTKVLTTRIIHIISSYLASPAQILAVTFTNKAAAEMRKRIGESIGDQVNNLWIGTFHSIAARILRRHAEVVGLKSDFTIIDQDDQTRLIKQILGDFNIDTKQYPAKNYLGKISRAKDLGKMESLQNDQDLGLPKLKEVYEMYQYRLKSMNSADFGDLLGYNIELFQKSPEILASYQDRFHYTLVDEYQDTNNTQYQWLLMLAKNQNICAVGDDDQSIYSWRGANIANILRFEKDFQNATVIRLERNYRSTHNILRAADSVILNNKERHGKTLWTEKKEGEKVKLVSYLDDRMEAGNVIETIRKYYSQRKYSKLSEIAILVRAGHQTRLFEEAFIRQSIPYKIIGGMKFYERMEIKDAICYLRIISNFSDDLALSRIINVPKRGVGDSTISAIYEKTKVNKICLYDAIKDSLEKNELKGKAKDALATLVAQIARWKGYLENHSLSETAKLVLMESGYLQMWQSENSLEAQGRVENIDEFVSSLGDFSDITEFLEYVSLVEAKEGNTGQDSVSVMTVHGAKGLEFDLVFIVGLEDGIFPSSRSVEERNGLEEERRLLYVAITRAKKELIMSYAKTRYTFGDVVNAIPSRFVKELPLDEIDDKSEKNAIYDEDQQFFGYKNNFSNSNKYTGNGGQKSFVNNNAYKNYTGPTVVKTTKAAENYDSNSKKGGAFGQRVFHQKFGYGKVVNIDGLKLEIEFEKTGKKTVMKDFVTFA